MSDLSSASNGVSILYAQWRPIRYGIVFNANGGSGSMAGISCTYGTETPLPANAFTFNGHSFSGWNTRADGSGSFLPDGFPVSTLSVREGDVITLYAQWDTHPYGIHFDSNGGAGSMADLSCSFGKAVPLTANLYKGRGFSLAGWNTKPDGSGTPYADKASVSNLTSSAGEVVTLYAQWKPASYRIRFHANRGSGSMAELPCVYDRASQLPPCGFSRPGYVFTGWNTRANGSGVAYNDGDELMNLTCSTKGVTVLLYAQWEPISYRICFDANGGSGSMAEQHLFYGAKAALSVNGFSRSGYRFTGWNTQPDGSGRSFRDRASVKNLALGQDEVVVLYAQWKEITYKIRFVKNGGTGSMATLSCGADGVRLPACGFSRSGYRFVSWNTRADGSGSSYSSGELVRGLSERSGATVTLYAQWR